MLNIQAIWEIRFYLIVVYLGSDEKMEKFQKNLGVLIFILLKKHLKS
jgi:hypothetical protein